MKNIVIQATDIFTINSSSDSDEKTMEQSVFGPFLKLSKTTLVMFDLKKVSKNEKIVKIAQFLLLLLALAPILARAIFLGTKMNSATLFTFNWAWNISFAFLANQGVASIIILYSKHVSNFFNNFFAKVLLASNGKMYESMEKPTIQKAHILMGIYMVYMFYCTCIFSVENIFTYDQYVTNVTNSTAGFRKSIFGAKKLFFLDITMMLWTTFISGLALSLYICCFQRVIQIYGKFNANLKRSLENEENDPIYILTQFESQHNNLLDLLKFNNDEWSNLATHTFLVGFIVQGMTGFLLRSFFAEVSLLTKIMIISYMILSLMIMIISTKLPSDLHNLLFETQDIVLSRLVLSREQSEKLVSSIDIIIKRVRRPTLSIYVLHCFKLTPQFQAGSLLIFAILIEFFNAYKKNINN